MRGMFTTYEEAVTFIETFIPGNGQIKFHGMLGLNRQLELLHLLGDPQETYPMIHVTGTAGKGSTSYVAASILKNAGYTVGLHVSPHILTVRERIQIGMTPVSEQEFLALVNEVAPAIEKLSAHATYGPPTFFEILVAMSFLAFAHHHVDIAVVEVGLGGKYDGTNITKTTKVAVITNVGLDHTEILGDTVEKIIQDKKEIIKTGSVCVTGATQQTVQKIIEDTCASRGVPLLKLGKDIHITDVHMKNQREIFDATIGTKKISEIECGLLGEYQVTNAALAITAVLSLDQKQFLVNDEAIQAGCRLVTCPGRMDVVSTHPYIIFDGAHNVDKMRALTTSFPQFFPYKKLIVVFALKKDKDAAHIVPYLTKLAGTIIVTEFERGSDMSSHICTSAKDLETLIQDQGFSHTIVETNSMKAYEKAKSMASVDDAILVTGSLYLVGELLTLIRS